MPKLINLVAQKPADAVKVVATEVDILAIEAIRELLTDAVRNNPDLVVRDVTSLRDVAIYLRDNPVQPGDRVQIVGHARSGRLELGSFWTGKDSSETDTFTLTSDVTRYDVLRGLIPPGAFVWLVGCSVGVDRIGTEPDGPTLVFDLAREWSCEVRAPVDLVGTEDFDDKGNYAHPDRMIVAKDRTVTAVTTATLPTTAEMITMPVIDRLTTMRFLGKDETIENLDTLCKAMTVMSSVPLRRTANVSSPLGLPEVVGAVSLRGVPTTMTVSSNATLFRFASDASGVYYTPESPTSFRTSLQSALSTVKRISSRTS